MSYESELESVIWQLRFLSTFLMLTTDRALDQKKEE